MLQKVVQPQEAWLMSRELIDQLTRLIECRPVGSPKWQTDWDALERLATKEARRQNRLKSATE